MRKLIQSDLPQLLQIERATHLSPWTDETFKLCFNAGCYGWGIEINKKIIGFIIVSLTYDECHILNLCISHAHQRQGWGRQLLMYALQAMQALGGQIAYLEVRRSNVKAIRLYQKLHFHLIGERKDYYPLDTGAEDALIYAKSIKNDHL